MVRKQAVAIAESLLEEIELQAFTVCDPDDANVLTATVPGDCATTAQGVTTTPATETRYGPEFFDNVADYNGFTMATIRDISNSAVAGLGVYSVTTPVAITQAGATFGLPAADVLRIDVTVNYGADSVMVTGYRFRYAPKAL